MAEGLRAMAAAPKNAAYRLVELARRLSNVVRPGTVAEVDLDAARVRVRYAGTPDDPVLTDWLPWIALRAGADAAEWWPPGVGEQAVLLAPNGDLAQAFALPAVYSNESGAPSVEQDLHLTRYADGAEIAYDAAAHHLSATLPEGATAAIEAPGGIAVTGNVAVDGTITATGNIESEADIEADGNVQDSAGTMTEMRDTYNTHTHASNGAAAPSQQMN